MCESWEKFDENFRTDDWTDGQTDKVNAVYHPLYEWGYNYKNVLLKINEVGEEI